MNRMRVQMERLVEKDTLHVLTEEVSFLYWSTVDKTHASLLIHQPVTLITSPAKVVCLMLNVYDIVSLYLLYVSLYPW